MKVTYQEKTVKSRKFASRFFIIFMFAAAVFALLPFGVSAQKLSARAENAPQLITARAELTAAINNASPGDTVWVGDIDFNGIAGGMASNANKRVDLNKSITIKGGKGNNEPSVFLSGSFDIIGSTSEAALTCKFENIIFDGTLGTSWSFWGDYLNNYAISFRNNVKVNFENCRFENYFNQSGGALTAKYDGTFESNHLFHLEISMRNCVFADNMSYYAGGAVYLSGNNRNIAFLAEDCIFEGNTDGGWGWYGLGGGAIYASSANFTFNGCKILNNDANRDYEEGNTPAHDGTRGGGLLCYGSDLKMTNCVISGNNASVGGGFSLINTPSYFDGCVISENSATTDVIEYIEDINYETEPPTVVPTDIPVPPFITGAGFGGGIHIGSNSASPAVFVNTDIKNNYAQNAYGGFFYDYEWSFGGTSPDGRGSVAFIFCEYGDNACGTDYDYADGIPGADIPGDIWGINCIGALGSIITDADFDAVYPHNETPNAENGYNYFGAVSTGVVPAVVPFDILSMLPGGKYAYGLGQFYVGNNYTSSVRISLNAAGSPLNGAELHLEYGKELLLPSPEKSGYTFDGWLLNDGSPFVTAGLMIAPDIGTLEITAKWTANTYAAAFVVDGEIFGQRNQTYGAQWDLDIDEPQKDGYKFSGWYTGKNGTGDRISAETLYLTDGDTALYADWEQIASPFPVWATALIVSGCAVLLSAALVTLLLFRKRRLALAPALQGTENGVSSPMVVVPVGEENIARLADKYKLTAREKEIVALLVEGKAQGAIARELFVSVPTVKKHAQNIYSKLDISSRFELIAMLTQVNPQEKNGGNGE